MGLLDGDIAGLFGSVFGAFYLDAVLVNRTLYSDGEGGGGATDTEQPVKVQQDRVTEVMRASGGYTERDARFLILQAGVSCLNSDSRLLFQGKTYALSNPEQDPAGSYWAVRGTPTS